MLTRSARRTTTDWQTPTNLRFIDAAGLRLVKLHKLDAAVEIKVHANTVYAVGIYGSAASVKRIRQTFTEGNLTLSGSRPGFKVLLDCLGRRLDTWLTWLLRPLSFLDIHIAQEFGRVVLYLPVGTPVEALVGFGDVTIGNTFAPLNARLLENGSLTAGVVGDADVRTYGTGSAVVEFVDGDATIQQNGPGGIDVQIVAGNRTPLPPDGR